MAGFLAAALTEVEAVPESLILLAGPAVFSTTFSPPAFAQSTVMESAKRSAVTQLSAATTRRQACQTPVTNGETLQKAQ